MSKLRKVLLDDIRAFCKLNNIEDIDVYINNLLEKAFTVEKYGSAPAVTIKTTETQQQQTTPAPPQKEAVAEVIIKPKENNDDDYEIYDEF